MKIPEQTSWQDVQSDKAYPELTGKVEVDVAIIGGGLTGITTAYLLSKAGKKVAIIESKNSLVSETTLLTTAFITKVIDTGLVELVKMYGDKKARMVWESGQAAIELIEQHVKEEKIDCDFKRVSYSIYANREEQFKNLEEEHLTAQRLGQETFLKKKNSFAFKNAGYLEVPNQAKFHPIKYALALANAAAKNGALIYTNSEVTGYSVGTSINVKTKNGSVKAGKVISAAYKPIKLLSTFAKKGMYQSFVYEASIPKKMIKEGLYSDVENPYHYFRVDSIKDRDTDRMIIGGEDHREEAKMNDSKNFSALEDYLEYIIGKEYTLLKKWSGPILEPSDGLALIGEGKPNQLVATAFSGNGMTYSHIAAMMFRDLIKGKKNPWTDLYDPKRSLKLKTFGRKAIDFTEEFYGGYVKNTFKKERK
ncbi:MAG: FAD-dependent oxidoreductase [Candidatus Doudnabacteria bacterium]